MQEPPRFGPAQAAYKTFRPRYPEALFERIVSAVPLDRRKRAVDLGAGTGLSTVPLCRWFDEVVAVEPDPDMAANLHGLHERIIVRAARAEEFEQPARSVDLVTSGTAFHWMDGPRVLSKIVEWLRSRGTLAIFSYRFPRGGGEVDQVLRGEMHEHWSAFRHPRLRERDYAERTVKSCAEMRDVSLLQIPYSVVLSPKELVGFFCSTSYGSAYMGTLAEPERYLRELEASLDRAAPGGRIETDFSVDLILAHTL